jgi:molybdenum cofactor sulfurtransferase
MSAILSMDHPSAAYLTAGIAVAERSFTRRFPGFDPDGSFAAMRRREYGRLDAEQHAYLDYSGGSLYANSQIEEHARLLRRGVFGNPHSTNPTSQAATALVADAREAALEFFGAPLDEYHCVFTANATGALKLVGEAYPFAPGGSFALMADNHNSVNGIREFARRKGAAIAYVPVIAPELRVDRSALTDVLTTANASRSNLLAFPAQSNFSGVQHPLDIIDEAHACGWEVLLDAAAFAPTNRLDVSRTRPDFVAASFYKIIGYPTGVRIC